MIAKTQYDIVMLDFHFEGRANEKMIHLSFDQIADFILVFVYNTLVTS